MYMCFAVQYNLIMSHCHINCIILQGEYYSVSAVTSGRYKVSSVYEGIPEWL